MNTTRSAILFLMMSPWAALAQWNTNGSGDLYNTNSGNVGIGTTSPQTTFDVAGSIVNGGADFYVGRRDGRNQGSLTANRAVVHTDWGIGNDNLILNFTGDFEGGVNIQGPKLIVDGNVGIGTISPSARLEVGGSGTALFKNQSGLSSNGLIEGAVNIFRFNDDANKVNTVLNLGNYWNSVSMKSNTVAIDFRAGDGGGVYGGDNPAARIKVLPTGGPPSMGFDLEGNTIMHMQSGKVGIGTTSPDATLAVKGDIHTREVRVDLTGATAPDYVFEKDYNLLPLSEIEAYISQNKHLPEVPSAKEMEANGVNLKEMNLLLLKKVEELTLHLIDANKKIESLDQQVQSLKKNNR